MDTFDSFPPVDAHDGSGNGCGGRGQKHRSRRDPLALKVNTVLNELIWLGIRLNSPAAEEFTITEVARLFALHGENFSALADLLGRAGLLTPRTVQQIRAAYDKSLTELLHDSAKEDL